MEELLKFVELTQEFKAVRRAIVMAKENRSENDAEHSYQLALIAWYIITTRNLELNLDLCIKYALVHDLIEVYAGDTPAIGKQFEEDRKTKHEREENAARKLQDEFPEIPWLHELIAAYEIKSDEESKFVYALDKVLPLMNIYLDKGHSWKLQGISLEDIIEGKKGKVDVNPEIKKYFDLMVERLSSDQATLFPTSIK